MKHPFYLLFVLVIFINSCASFDKSLKSTTSLNDINGKYEVIPIKYDSVLEEHRYNFLRNRNLYTLIDYGAINKKKLSSETNKYHLEIKTIDAKHTQINYLENDFIIDERIIKTKFKKDGYLYFKKTKVRVKGIPYILGHFNFIKTRLTLDNNKNLTVDLSDFSTGAGLFIISLHFEGDITNEKFKKID